MGVICIAAEHIGVTFLTRRQADRTARDSRLPQIEGRTGGAHASAQHHKPGFRRAKDVVRMTGEIAAPRIEVSPLREGKQPHPLRTREKIEGTFRLGHDPINQLFVTAL
jgi:hypothetical protein